ncbi:MAG: C4-dicarboxylate ABC transporter substrate-binding protein, partial [Propionibacteriales bacterium]|nr:C4-dicarboxylate ABC transporter substrate-binding protein [Propionibacteriales bacterium]
GLADEGGESGEQVTLNLSHQWPAPDQSGEGDFRAVLAERFAEEVSERTDGEVEIRLHPGNSLIEDPTEQYEAITQGASDLSVFPLDYAAGDVPEFSITLMPAMVPNHEVAQEWQDAEIGERVEQITEENGVKVLTWVWNAGAVGTRSADPIVSPDDVPNGSVTRAAGVRVEEMLESVGFGLSSMASSEIYNGMQTGVLDSAITSTGSFSSYRLDELVKTYTSPTGGYTFWFMFEPLIIGMDQFEQLSEEQQDVLVEVGAELQDFAYEASQEDDVRVDEEFESAGVNVVPMDEAAFQEWQEASQPIWDNFASDVDNGQELIDLASQVSGD